MLHPHWVRLSVSLPCISRDERRCQRKSISEPVTDKEREHVNTGAMRQHMCDLVMDLPVALLPSLQEFIEILIRDTTR